ncbi:MAG: NifB/NifX family molybdenum-iron cluster-binding protein [Dehalococcoidia bacterium]
MKVAVSATGPFLDAEVNQRLGRCSQFLVVDSETMEFEVLENISAEAASGAGVSAAEMVANQGVQAVITGNCGPKAYDVFSSAGVEVISGVSGTVRSAVDSYRSGQLEGGLQSPGPRSGRGAGLGRGMGTGRGGRVLSGRGRGRGMATGMSRKTRQRRAPYSEARSGEEDLQALKEASQSLSRQLAQIDRRITELEKKQ